LWAAATRWVSSKTEKDEQGTIEFPDDLGFQPTDPEAYLGSWHGRDAVDHQAAGPTQTVLCSRNNR